jgi:hypothetical protein
MKKFLFMLSFILIIVFWFAYGPMAQNENYHKFADCRHMMGVPYAFDVLSNLPFLFVGIIGLYFLLKNKENFKETFYMYLVFFVFVFLVGIGSGYYHLAPDSKTLVWDRLPMSVAFMAMFTFVLSEYIDVTIAKKLFLPLLVCGVGSVVYWAYFNDLRPYAIVQFFPLIILPVILWKYKNEYSKWLWWALAFYVLAKVFETYDKQIFNLTGEMASGHSIKHVSSAVATLMIFFKIRQVPPTKRNLEEPIN